MGFWDDVYELREKGLIPLVWTRADIREHLQGKHSLNYINTAPGNWSMTEDGGEKGNFVKNGQPAKAWRVWRGTFRLIDDPDDSANQKLKGPSASSEGYITRREQGYVHKAMQDSVVVSGNYESFSVTLNDAARESLSGLSTADKAEMIVFGFLKRAYGDQIQIKKARDGADLRVEFDDGNSFGVEVKGTSDATIAWSKLKVSSQKSHDGLESGDVIMFRVVDVDSEKPRIYVLEYGRDYYMEPEPRWAVKRAEPTDRKRYPFVGKPYRYDDPYEPVAVEDWEALK